jgi:NADH-quinone oxidoreductase subunit L
MTWLASHAIGVVLVPLAAAAVLGAFGRWLKPVAPWIALLGPLTALVGGIGALAAGSGGVAAAGGTGSASVPWIIVGDVSLSVGYRVDALSAVMLVVLGVVATCVIVFSVGYMRGERGWSRYFALLSLFCAAMAGLVIASGFVELFVGWELVGVCSFLLIGFWYDRPAAADAARKAFLTTRVGDAGLLLAMGLIWARTGSLSIGGLNHAVATLPAGVVTAVALLLFLGAAGKSAQFPLHIWLPDAMEGPTPVSALIHAATMVAAGVYLVARTWPVFAASPVAQGVVLVVGTFTALAAATVALTQTDIKKMLAYSTISQLGFMFAALGAGNWRAAIFHLVTHAAFKALLFLAAGSVIHGAGTQDLRRMGGLIRRMPVTAVAWIAGGLALAGIPPLAGFFSKDTVIAAVMTRSPVAAWVLLLASLITATYVARATQLAFFGDSREVRDAHESPASMTVPLGALALLACTLGFAATALLQALGAAGGEGISAAIAVPAVLAGVAGLAAGWLVWAGDAAAENAFPSWLETMWGAARTGYGFDAGVLRATVQPVMTFATITYQLADRIAIDGAVEGVAKGADGLAEWLRELQNGDVHWYGAMTAAGVVVLLTIVVWLTRGA